MAGMFCNHTLSCCCRRMLLLLSWIYENRRPRSTTKCNNTRLVGKSCWTVAQFSPFLFFPFFFYFVLTLSKGGGRAVARGQPFSSVTCVCVMLLCWGGSWTRPHHQRTAVAFSIFDFFGTSPIPGGKRKRNSRFSLSLLYNYNPPTKTHWELAAT
jgi:hypothetical protein